MLIFVEGVANYQGQSYWWGGNLMGVRDRPIDLAIDNKVVYSARDYPNSVYAQPWFQGANFAENLPAKFDQMWGYIYKENIAPVYIGEFGTRLTDPKDAPWLEAITLSLGDLDNNGTHDLPAGKQGVSWTFWSWRPQFQRYRRHPGRRLADGEPGQDGLPRTHPVRVPRGCPVRRRHAAERADRLLRAHALGGGDARK